MRYARRLEVRSNFNLYFYAFGEIHTFDILKSVNTTCEWKLARKMILSNVWNCTNALWEVDCQYFEQMDASVGDFELLTSPTIVLMVVGNEEKAV